MWSEQFTTPLAFLGDRLGGIPDAAALAAYEHWWETQGQVISEAVDRAGTPWLRMFDRAGTRIDEVCFPPGYWTMLRKGYREGIISRVFEQNSLLPFYRTGYVTAFHDPFHLGRHRPSSDPRWPGSNAVQSGP